MSDKNKSIEITEEQKQAAIMALWEWDQDFESGEVVLSRVPEALGIVQPSDPQVVLNETV